MASLSSNTVLNSDTYGTSTVYGLMIEMNFNQSLVKAKIISNKFLHFKIGIAFKPMGYLIVPLVCYVCSSPISVPFPYLKVCDGW